MTIACAPITHGSATAIAPDAVVLVRERRRIAQRHVRTELDARFGRKRCAAKADQHDLVAVLEMTRRLVEPWNRVLEQHGMADRLTLPDRKFNRNIGMYANRLLDDYVGDLGLALLGIWLVSQVNPGIPLFAATFDPSLVIPS